MLKLNVFLLLLVATLASPAQWREVTSVPVGSVEAIDSADGVYLLATGTGVYRSTNGLSWSTASVGLPQQRYVAIAFDGDQAYVATAAGQVFRSPDYGTVWVPHGFVPSQSALVDLVVAHNTVYAVTNSALYMYSSGTWAPVGDVAPGSIHRAHVANNTLYVCSSGDGVFAFSETHQWEPLNLGLFDLDVRDLVSHNNTLYALTLNNGVFQYSDNVGQWQQLGTFGIEGLAGSALHVSQDVLCAAFFAGEVYSYDGHSRKWYQLPDLSVEATPVLLFTISQQFFAGTRLHGLWRIASNNTIVDVSRQVSIRQELVYQKVVGDVYFKAHQACSVTLVDLLGNTVERVNLYPGQVFNHSSIDVGILVVQTTK